MKKVIYIIIFVIFILLTFYNAKIIQKKKEKDSPSIVLNWKEKGMPVKTEKIKIKKLTKEIKISGKLKGKKIKSKISLNIKNLINLNQSFYLNSNKKVKGKLTHISNEENTLYGMYSVELTLNKFVKNLQDEIVVAKLEYKNKKAKIIVPNKAIVRNKNLTFIWINKNGLAHRKPITLGESSANYTEVLSGLNKHEQIITEGKEFLKEKVKVKPVEEL
jgi:hypothetical protein